MNKKHASIIIELKIRTMRKACKTAIQVVGMELTLSSRQKNDAEDACCSNNRSFDVFIVCDIPASLSRSANECWERIL